VATGGGSAERKAQELAAAGAADAWMWSAGAAGERRVADELANLREAWTVLHDRLIRPGRSGANLDHVVVGPAGLFLVDAKDWSGNVTAWNGGLYQHVGPTGGRTSHSKHVEVAKVHGMAAYMAVEMGVATTPVICLAGESEATFGEPQIIRGVWVVPVSKLLVWLEAQPVVLDRETVGKTVTRAMTSFPSTTTDPDLLAAMGLAATAARRSRRGRSSSGRRVAKGQSRSRGAGRGRNSRRSEVPMAARFGRFIGRLFLGFLVIALLVAIVPPLLTAGLNRMTSTPGAPTPSQAASGSSAQSSQRTGKAAASPSKTPAAPGPPNCATATAGQIAKIVGRKVQPIATSSGCAWGTRLDDSWTTLVTIRMPAGHAAYETQLVTSVHQRRVVYGLAVDAHFRPATALWVATGRPITKGNAGVKARADTYVVVARTALNVSDDRARSMALAIAAAANTTR
jgi:hypothetical protein